MRLIPTNPLAGLVGASLIAAATFAHPPAHASGFPCFDDAAMQSARIHDLKVSLMVNALKCREVNPMTLRGFGQLLDQRSGEFAGHEIAVKRSLEGRFGPSQAAAMFDDYETRIGNYHAGVSPSREVCEDTAAVIRLASRASSAELETLAQLVTNRGIRACPVERPVELAATPAITVREAPRPAPRPVPRPAMTQPSEIVDGIPTYSTPGTGPTSAPVPLERVAVPEAAAPVVEQSPVRTAQVESVAEAVSEPGAAERETQLAQAITALDAAAAALRGMQSGRQAPAK